jgi:hypothetical protein
MKRRNISLAHARNWIPVIQLVTLSHYADWSVASLIISIMWHKIRVIGTHSFNIWGLILKVHGLTLLLQVRTLWRCSDGLFFEVPHLAGGARHTMLHPLLKNVLQTVDHFKISYLRAPFSLLEKPRNHMGWDLDCMADVLIQFHWSTFLKPNTEFNSE